jgi:phospholipid-binding lipoprotein MlaA
MNARGVRCAAGLLAVLVLSACATVPKDPGALATYRANNDPLEPLNRKTFALNQGVDRYLIKPIAKAYVKVIPPAGRNGISNFIANLHEPVVFANNVLQFQFKRAGTTASRFVINTTVGVVGLIDFAGKHGLKHQSGDFGQTLWTWGLPEGPYLVIPVFGPTSPRDGIGSGVDIFLDPFIYLARHNQYRTAISYSRLIVGGIDLRARNLDTLDELQKESVDFYAGMRSLYRQNRIAELHNGVAPPQPKLEDLYNDPDEIATPPAPPAPSPTPTPPD